MSRVITNTDGAKAVRHGAGNNAEGVLFSPNTGLSLNEDRFAGVGVQIPSRRQASQLGTIPVPDVTSMSSQRRWFMSTAHVDVAGTYVLIMP